MSGLQYLFLFGSGVSIPAQLPSTDAITERVIAGVDVVRHTDGTYYFDSPDREGMLSFDNSVRRVVLLLERLRIEIEMYYLYDFSTSFNYEELYYVCAQLHDSELREYENPVAGPFIERISKDIHRIRQESIGEGPAPWQVHQLFFEAMNYIRDVVWRMLWAKPARLDHLECIIDACRDSKIDHVFLFTLNHDTLLEQALARSGIDFASGFSEAINEVRYWESGLLSRDKSKTQLAKLHGSLNWFIFPPNRISQNAETVGMFDGPDVWHTLNPDGQRQTPTGGRPLLLIGTFNKMLDYTGNIFADLHCLFRDRLRSCRHLIVIGYGFGDKGINSQIIEWMYQSKENKIIVCSPDMKSVVRKSRGAIQRNWKNWVLEERLNYLEMGIQDVSWSELSEVLGLPREKSR